MCNRVGICIAIVMAKSSALADEGPYGAQGGRMGTYRQGELVSTLDEPAFALEVGQLSDPIVTGQGTFLLYIFDRYPEEPPPFEEVRDRLCPCNSRLVPIDCKSSYTLLYCLVDNLAHLNIKSEIDHNIVYLQNISRNVITQFVGLTPES